MEFTGQGTPLTHEDYKWAAEELAVDIPALKAVVDVESGGRGGFMPDGRPLILFEAHYFSRLTDHVYDKSHPLISVPNWDRRLYAGGRKEYERLDQALELDASAALQSCSWGMFQIMGANHARCGHPNVFLFVRDMCKDELHHLKAFMEFIKSAGLVDELRDHRWADFARVYNGPSFAQNGYDAKLSRAYQKYASVV